MPFLNFEVHTSRKKYRDKARKRGKESESISSLEGTRKTSTLVRLEKL